MTPATPPATGGPAPATPPAPPADKVDVTALMVPGPLGDQALGDPKAPVTIVEYASMTCPHCQRFYEGPFKTLKTKYIDTGKVRFIFREFPLDALSAAAFMVARCAPPDKFFAVVDVLFDLQQDWAFVNDPGPAMFKVVQPIGFTQDSFNACLDNQKILDGISWVRDRAANTFGVQGTPTFFFNGQRHEGELDAGELDKLLAPML